jgi:hypothetical protein
MYNLLKEKLRNQDFPSRVVVLSSKLHKDGVIDLNDLNYRNGKLKIKNHFLSWFL